MFRSQLETEHKERETVSEFPKNVVQAETSKKIKVKIRFDYKGLPRPAKFFFGGKSSRERAEELRDQQSAAWRNIPLQGVRVENIEFIELYSVYDDIEEAMLTFAPMELTVTIDSLEECLRFACRDEFRRMEILEPSSLNLESKDLEKIFYQFNVTLQQILRDIEIR